MNEDVVVKIFKVSFLIGTFLCAPLGNTVELNKGQRLACGAILCAVGIAIPASHSECRKVLQDWSIYLATLGPFRSKPKCPIIANNQAVSYSTMTCSSIVDPEFRSMCDNANNTKPQPGYHRCDTIVDGYQRFECENSCDSKYKDRDGNLVCLVE
jgi:hypothetical protein